MKAWRCPVMAMSSSRSSTMRTCNDKKEVFFLKERKMTPCAWIKKKQRSEMAEGQALPTTTLCKGRGRQL